MAIAIRALKVFAYVWGTLAAIVIVIGYVTILIQEGFSQLREVMDPFNVINFAVTVIAFSPAIGALLLANYLESKYSSR